MSGLQGFVGSNIMRVGVDVGARQAVLTLMLVGLSPQWRLMTPGSQKVGPAAGPEVAWDN